jgi:MFS family permease
MAWLANPFAYIAMNAAIPLIPGLANRLGLSPRQAGFFCSIWFFSRMISFAVLGKWERWHYRFDYLVMSYAGMLVCFAAMLLLNHLWLIVLAQVVFGWCVGLIYYSSLYYSMCGSSTKGEHGGVHEAAIGAGIFGGPAIGAASIYFVPQVHGSGIFGVTAALLIGLGGLFVMRTRKA